MKRALVALAVAGCGTPTPQLLLGLAAGPAQACPSTSCAGVPLPCDPVMSIRIVEPGEPGTVYLEQCTVVPQRTPNDACALNGVDLDSTPLPVRRLEVQVAVFARAQLASDDKGNPICPVVQYSGDGFPAVQPPSPALGRRTYYQPGDQTVNVALGCTDLSSAHVAACGAAAGTITATVEDFDTRLSVTGGAQGVANDLWVSVGEPHSLEGRTVLRPLDLISLRLGGGDPPTWSGAVSQKFTQHACVEVIEDVAQTTPALRCHPRTDAPVVELKGMRISRDTLKAIVSSLGMSKFPDEGLTVGMVVDTTMARGVSDYVVTAPNATVSYLSPSGMFGGSTTSASGIFVSRDAPFGTLFSATGPSATVPAIGGLVAGKVTIVIVPIAALADQ